MVHAGEARHRAEGDHPVITCPECGSDGPHTLVQPAEPANNIPCAVYECGTCYVEFAA